MKDFRISLDYGTDFTRISDGFQDFATNSRDDDCSQGKEKDQQAVDGQLVNSQLVDGSL